MQGGYVVVDVDGTACMRRCTDFTLTFDFYLEISDSQLFLVLQQHHHHHHHSPRLASLARLGQRRKPGFCFQLTIHDSIVIRTHDSRSPIQNFNFHPRVLSAAACRDDRPLHGRRGAPGRDTLRRRNRAVRLERAYTPAAVRIHYSDCTCWSLTFKASTIKSHPRSRLEVAQKQ
ncbi:hypothetical protein IE81DRAFT_146112 [Ceraceosorus guamensis]|uniref:Uncharacterized protein n=1 Tax=Ceraceosorus guamensis TaxID=1522189 RepID=A0A316VWM8_9BASI|nr:hypothetical protein IE81DRAFT_146112 [Ceraceosorus guamensis]PWN42047.1 hypothetical protein IE81DRAFT_146112 [Ceraceosorus guamensis]